MEVQIVEGTALQSQKQYQSHGQGIAATLHSEFWLRLPDDSERRVSLVNCDFPIRQSNQVALVYVDSMLGAVVNKTTGEWMRLPTVPALSPMNSFLRLFVVALVVCGVIGALALLLSGQILLAVIAVPMLIYAWRRNAAADRRRQRLIEEHDQAAKTQISQLLGIPT